MNKHRKISDLANDARRFWYVIEPARHTLPVNAPENSFDAVIVTEKGFTTAFYAAVCPGKAPLCYNDILQKNDEEILALLEARYTKAGTQAAVPSHPGILGVSPVPSADLPKDFTSEVSPSPQPGIDSLPYEMHYFLWPDDHGTPEEERVCFFDPNDYYIDRISSDEIRVFSVQEQRYAAFLSYYILVTALVPDEDAPALDVPDGQKVIEHRIIKLSDLTDGPRRIWYQPKAYYAEHLTGNTPISDIFVTENGQTIAYYICHEPLPFCMLSGLDDDEILDLLPQFSSEQSAGGDFITLPYPVIHSLHVYGDGAHMDEQQIFLLDEEEFSQDIHVNAMSIHSFTLEGDRYIRLGLDNFLVTRSSFGPLKPTLNTPSDPGIQTVTEKNERS